MPSGEPFELSASEALRRLQDGSLSVEALARSCLERVADRDDLIKAWTTVDPDLVIRQARALEGRAALPLAGLPIGVKDVIVTRDLPTTYNSPGYQGHHPEADAACIKLIRAAGGLVFGKTDTVEFAATGRKAATVNPHDQRRTPGGSSSGSAAAVADLHVPLALGTQTGGSMIRPASYCGVWAVKPTWNLVANEGAKMFSASLDTLGWFGRSAEDLAILYAVLDPEWRPPEPLALRGAEIAVCRTPVWDQAEAATREAMETAAERLVRAGAKLIELDLPPPFERLPDAQVVVMRAEARSVFLAEQAAIGDRLDPSLVDYARNAWNYTREELLRALDLAGECRAAFDRLARPYVAVLAPSTAGEAPLGLSETGPMVFNGFWTLLHTPCVNVPGLSGPSGLPVGLTATGPRFDDRDVLAAAAAIGAALAG